MPFYDHRLADVPIDQQYLFAYTPKGGCNRKGRITLSFTVQLTCKHNGLQVISAELDIGAERLDRFLVMVIFPACIFKA